MEAKKLGFKDSKGKEKDVDWTPFECLVEVAVDMAAREEEEEEEELKKERMSLKVGFKIDINAVNNNSPDFSEKTFVVNHKNNPSPMNENPVNPRSLRIFGTEIPIGERKTDDVSCKSKKNFLDLSKKKSCKEERVNLKRHFEAGETSGIKKPKLNEENQSSLGIVSPHQQTGLPERLKEMIKGMEGTDEKLIIQKSLFKTDLNEHHCRLSIPKNQVKVEFLTDEEEKNVLKQGSDGKNSKGLETSVIDPSLKTRDMVLKRWDMKKPSGKTCPIYALERGWNSVVKDNNLKENDVIQLWSFRVNSKLYFALVIV